MQINNNSQSPNFGMGFYVKSRAGLQRFIGGAPEKIEQIYKYAAEVRKADLKQTRAMNKALAENGLTFEDMPSTDYLAATFIDENGRIIQRRNRNTGYKTIVKNLDMADYKADSAMSKFLHDMNDSLNIRAAKARDKRIERAMDDIVGKFSIDA